MIANLERYALSVKSRFSGNSPMGVGLWLAAPAASELLTSDRLTSLANWLADCGLVPFTLNGFPYGDFHEPVVKRRVYQPTWFESSRLEYTLDLITILDALLPRGMEGSISTLPLAWRHPGPDADQMQAAVQNLRHVARRLAALEEQTGRLIYVCLEPEPGCVLQRSDDVVRFFHESLCRHGDTQQLLRYIRVCHDVCHTAVMFEDQRSVLSKYAASGIRVGKVQVSSAVRVQFDAANAADRTKALSELASFAEDRYLHQTVIASSNDAPPRFFDDLPEALNVAADDVEQAQREWRVHFHVPIYLRQFGAISTTHDDIRLCLQATDLHPDLTHFEVETYAWGVLPEDLKQAELSDGIAREMQWLVELDEFR